MHHHHKCKSALILIFGVLFFLNTLGVWPEFTLVKYWPLVFIVMGLHGIFCEGKECEEMKKKK